MFGNAVRLTYDLTEEFPAPHAAQLAQTTRVGDQVPPKREQGGTARARRVAAAAQRAACSVTVSMVLEVLRMVSVVPQLVPLAVH